MFETAYNDYYVKGNNDVKYSKKLNGYYPGIESKTKDNKKFGINDINNLTEVQTKMLEYFKDKYLSNSKISKPIKNIDTGMNIEIWKKGILETFGNKNYYKNLTFEQKQMKIAVMDSLAKMIKYGEVRTKSAPNYHNSNSTAKYHYLEHPINIDGINYMVNLDIRKVPNTNGRFYIHSIDTKKVETPGNSKSRPLTVSTDVDNISQSNDNVKSDTSSTKYSIQENQNDTQNENNWNEYLNKNWDLDKNKTKTE